MKHLILSLFILAFVFALSGDVQAQKFGKVTCWTKIDTLNANEDLYFYPNDADNDTVAWDFHNGSIWFGIVSDSLSGATDVTTKIQMSSVDPPYVWVTADNGTLTSNGASQQVLNLADDQLNGAKWRIWSDAGSGTQATQIKKCVCFKRE